MMRLLTLSLCCSILSILVVTCTIRKREATTLVRSEMQKQNIPGIAVTVIRQNKIIFTKGFGYADVRRKTPVDPVNTLFRVASISKPMTSALLARLYENGLIHPDSSVYTYLSTYPKKRYDFTVRQLAGHTAGIRSYSGNEFYSDSNYMSVRSALHVFWDDSLLFKPGTGYLYSSYGWNLLSYLSEEVTGIPYIRLMKDSVFSVLEMKHTFPNDKFYVGRDKYRTGYYTSDGDSIRDERDVDLSNKWAGGGFESSSEDVARFADRFWFTDYITPESRQLFTSPQTLEDGKSTHYGMGWIQKVDNTGRTYFGHAGAGVGGKSMMLVYPEYETVIVVLSNKTDANLEAVYSGLASVFFRD